MANSSCCSPCASQTCRHAGRDYRLTAYFTIIRLGAVSLPSPAYCSFTFTALRALKRE